MANPNRAFAHVAKRPWEPVCGTRNAQEAAKVAADLAADGWEVKRTRGRMGPRNKPFWVERVWKRAKQ